MTQPEDPHSRVCPRCERVVPAERHQGVGGRTWLWRCACGWSSAVAESGVVTRSDVEEALRQVRGANGTDDRSGS